MTQLETLNARLGQLNNLLDAIDAAASKIYDQERMDLANVLEKFFTAEEGDIVDCSYSSVNIRKRGDNQSNSFLTIYADDCWDENDRRVYNKLYVNNYSFRTDEMAEWIVERFEKQAYYTRIAVDFQDDILAEMNQITDAANQLVVEISKPRKELRKEATQIQQEIKAIEKEARMKALMSEEGLEIKGVEKTRYNGENTYIEYPDLQVKFDWTLRSIRGLRIDKVSASGKSADITVKIKKQEWLPSTNEWIEKIAEEKVERVRMDNIESFLRYNSISI
jgi:hypothetical protein